MQMFHELREDEYDKNRILRIIVQRIDEDSHLIKSICFSDQSTFFLNGIISRYICRYSDNENPHIFWERHRYSIFRKDQRRGRYLWKPYYRAIEVKPCTLR